MSDLKLFCKAIHRSPKFLFSFSVGNCVVCPSIYGFRLPLWYLQTLLQCYKGDNSNLILQPDASKKCLIKLSTIG